jgi:chaperonin GroEL
MLKKTLYGSEARDKMLAGIKKIVDAIRVTLGPQGRNVVVAQSAVVDYGVHSLPLHITKDGATVARGFDLEDYFEKVGVMIIKECTFKTVDQAGDGTSSCAILAHAILEKAVEFVESGANPVELKKSIEIGVEKAISQLKELSTPIKGDIDRIRQVATISANNDPEIGGWIADAFAKIGDEGIIDLEASKGVRTEIKISDGYKWDQSWTSPLFITNREKQTVEFENPLILIYHNRINHHTQIMKALELCQQSGKPLLIICEDAVEEGLAFMVLNTLQGRVKVCAVKSPAFGEDRRIELEDLALLTGADYISDVRGINIKEIAKDNFGAAKKVIVTKDETIIIGGGGNKDSIENHINELRMNLAEAKNEDEKYPIEKRIAKLKGGVAVIQVGAATETEMKEKLDRFDDAVRATKAAIAEGFVAGGGTTYLRIRSGNAIVDYAMDMILNQICLNAAVDAKRIVAQVKGLSGNMGYNAKTDKIEDLVEAGVIDPTKVIRCALTNAASSAGMILTTEAMIVDTM